LPAAPRTRTPAILFFEFMLTDAQELLAIATISGEPEVRAPPEGFFDHVYRPAKSLDENQKVE